MWPKNSEVGAMAVIDIVETVKVCELTSSLTDWNLVRANVALAFVDRTRGVGSPPSFALLAFL